MSRVAIFIDGGYLNSTLRLEHGSPRIEYESLSRELASGLDILRTYYYNCLPYQSNQPTDEERARYSEARRFYDALNRLPRYEVRFGKLAKVYDEKGVPKFEQKRVDILLGVDLVLLSAKHLITHAVVLAGDSDFIPAIAAAKNEGVLVHLYHGQSLHRELYDAADERTAITPELIRRVLRR